MQPGVVYATLAFVWWGLFPLYFRIVTTVPAPEILAHRVVWCLLLLAAILTWRRQWGWVGQVARQPKVLAAFVAHCEGNAVAAALTGSGFPGIEYKTRREQRGYRIAATGEPVIEVGDLVAGATVPAAAVNHYDARCGRARSGWQSR